MRIRLFLAVAAMAMAACSRGDVTQPGVTRADSAGIRLITSAAADTTLLWRFTEVDVLRDTLGEPYLFTRLWGRAVLTDRAGRVYVLTRDPSILRFGRDGKLERTIGRQGGGPGEMQLPALLVSSGDTLVVLDLMKRSLVRWGPTLDPISDRRLEGALERANDLAFRSGGLWFQRFIFSDSGLKIGFYSDSIGPPLHQVTIPSGGPVKFKCIGLSQSTPLFSPTISWAVNGPRVIVNQGPAYSLSLYEGPRLIASIRRSIAPRAPTVEDVRVQYPEGYKVSFGGDRPPCITPVEDVMKGFGLAPVYPAVHDVALLGDGTIWVQRTPFAAKEPVLDVFAPDGAYVGTVRGMNLPVGMLPNGQLLVPRTDEASGGLVLARVKMDR